MKNKSKQAPLLVHPQDKKSRVLFLESHATLLSAYYAPGSLPQSLAAEMEWRLASKERGRVCPKEWEKMHGRPEHCALWSHRDCLTGSVPAQAAFPRSSQELSKATKGPLTVYTLTIAGEMALRPSCPTSGASLLVTRWRSSVTVPHPTIILWLTLLGHFWLSWWLGSAIKL